MKTLLSSLIAVLMVWPTLAEEPKISVYLIKKMDQESPNVPFPEVIFEISNPTKNTFYFYAGSISSPIYRTEVTRKGKWLRVPSFICGTGLQIYPLKPGAKMLVAPSILFEEKEFRFRYYFSLDPKLIGEGVEVLSPPIKRSQLGDLMGTVGEVELEKIDDKEKK